MEPEKTFVFNETILAECLLTDNCQLEFEPSPDEILDQSHSLLPEYVFIILQVVYCLIFITGLVGNTLVIYVVSRFPGLHTVTNTYILNLAIADECFLLGLPLLIVTMILKQWTLGSSVCTLYLVTTSVNQLTSSLFLMVLAGDRYIAVCHPILAPSLRTRNICRAVVCITWVVSAMLMTPVFLYSGTVEDTEHGTVSCNIVWSLDSWSQDDLAQYLLNPFSVFTIYSFIFGFAGPCLLILVFYGLVLLQLWCWSPGVRSQVMNRSRSQVRLQRKVTKLILTVITVYILTWAPHWTLQIIIIFAPGLMSPEMMMLMVMITSCLHYANSAINPILYAFLSDHFKKSFRETCLCMSHESQGLSVYRQRDLTFTTRRTRRGRLYTAVLLDETSARPGGDHSTTHVTHVSTVSSSRGQPRPQDTMKVVGGLLAPPSIR